MLARRSSGQAIDVVTFGCRLNTYESEVIKAEAARAGLEDAIVFNTCAVTGEAVRQARQAIRRARREQPGRRIIVTGCAAQTESTRFAEMPEVDSVIGNAEKLAGRQLPRPAGFRRIGHREGTCQRHHERNAKQRRRWCA